MWTDPKELANQCCHPFTETNPVQAHVGEKYTSAAQGQNCAEKNVLTKYQYTYFHIFLATVLETDRDDYEVAPR